MSYFALSDWARRGSSSLATVGHYLPIPPSPFSSESSASRPSQDDDDDDDDHLDDHHLTKVEAKLHSGYLAPSSPRGQYLAIDGDRPPRLHSRSPSSSSAGSSSAGSTRPRSWLARRDPVLIFVVLLSIATFVALLVAFPFPTTVHAFAAIFVGVTAWTQISCLRIVFALALVAWRGNPKALAKGLPRWSTAQYSFLLVLSTFVLYCLSLGLVPPLNELPPLDRDLAGAPPGKYFIAANLYNNEDLVPHWSDQVVKLAEHLGPSNTFVSIYESNSKDKTPELLADLATRLTHLGVPNRVISEKTARWWAYGTSPERIGFLSAARNKAIEPLQSPDVELRLPDYHEFTKIVFLNDIFFSWQSAVRLLTTSLDGKPGEDGYDLACGMDFNGAGLYDTWVARDICGTPMRTFWPYVKDPVSVARLRQNVPMEVSACWNGMVAFPAAPYLFTPTSAAQSTADERNAAASPGLAKRGWKMVDNATYVGGRMSPPLPSPIQFRISGVDACDHSECFLFSLDLHRLYSSTDRRPRILMNPDVRTGYSVKWWKWNDVVLRIPVLKFWNDHWSRGYPLNIVDFIFEKAGRKRDYCTWSALATHAPSRCPPLPGAIERPWNVAG
ncbi:uncharacterized protein LOC62_07G009282 [Vanrija pseudolonga]|uniref:Glycosyltransferase family 69 protein n=1 Tax=Vanrija pseudolonga TaxID=143232 RepID=A0AAF1BLF3_9TREE|nr:hypothetical protein LOC62_07G009282 [Vanrija pseudolonga]